jgi:hypothetical protein
MRVAEKARRGDLSANSKSDESIGLNKTEIKPRRVKRFPLGGEA